MNFVKICLLIGLIFSPLAAVMTFLISYEEYKHHYRDSKTPFRLAFSSAIVTFIVFMVVSALGGILFAHTLHV